MQLLTNARRGVKVKCIRKKASECDGGEDGREWGFSRSFGRVPLKNVTAFAWIAAASTLTTPTTVTHRSRFKKEHRHATTSSRKKVSGA
jgi:hypothetical protein